VAANDELQGLDAIIRLIRDVNDLQPNAKIRTPFAFVVSKLDAVMDFLDPGSPLRDVSEHPGYLDLADIERTDASVRAFVAHWLGPDVDDRLISNFKTFRYFAVSSFGWAPISDDIPLGIAPFRVTDPFLWLLYSHGLVPGR
jgi:hypothetical protein